MASKIYFTSPKILRFMFIWNERELYFNRTGIENYWWHIALENCVTMNLCGSILITILKIKQAIPRCDVIGWKCISNMNCFPGNKGRPFIDINLSIKETASYRLLWKKFEAEVAWWEPGDKRKKYRSFSLGTTVQGYFYAVTICLFNLVIQFFTATLKINLASHVSKIIKCIIIEDGPLGNKKF